MRDAAPVACMASGAGSLGETCAHTKQGEGIIPSHMPPLFCFGGLLGGRGGSK